MDGALAIKDEPMEDCRYFYEDEVYRFDKKGNIHFGMVIESAGMSSDSEDDEDDEDDDDDDDDEESWNLKKGQVLVAWYPDGREKVHKETVLCLSNRSLMPGDVVRRQDPSGKRSQTGYCRNIKVSATMEIVGSGGRVVYGIKSEDLEPVEKFTENTAICLGSWVGVIGRVKSSVTLDFPDGVSSCIVDDSVASQFEDVRDQQGEDSQFKKIDFYPGMILTAPLREFRGAEWISCSNKLKLAKKRKPGKMVKVIVRHSEVKGLVVRWQCQAFLNRDENLEVPDVIVSGEDLKRVKLLNYFEPCTLQIGDRRFYTLKEEDVIISKKFWNKIETEYLAGDEAKDFSANNNCVTVEKDDAAENDVASTASSGSKQSSKRRSLTLSTNSLKNRKLKRSKKSSFAALAAGNANLQSPRPSAKPGDRVVLETLCTRSEVAVVWQTGDLEEDIDSRELYPIHHLDDREFFAGDFVVRCADVNDHQIYGVVQKVGYDSRVCHTKWFKTYTVGGEPSPLFTGESEDPVYDLRDHPDFNYRPGSIVIKVADMEEDEVDGGLGGQILEVNPTGKVSVRWANEKTTECWPQDLYKIGEYDSDDGELWDEASFGFDSEDDCNDDSWEVLSEHSVKESDTKESSSNPDANPQVAAYNLFEAIRTSVSKLEEKLIENPKLSRVTVLREWMDIFNDCIALDEMTETSFFDTKNFDGFIEQVPGHLSKAKRNEFALRDQICRLFFSVGDPEQLTDEAGGEQTLALKDDQQTSLQSNCQRFSQLLKSQLVMAHDAIVKKFGARDFVALNEEEVQHQSKEDDLLLSNFGLTLGDANESDAAFLKKDKPNTLDESSSPDKEICPTNFSGVCKFECGAFTFEECAPKEHKFKVSLFEPKDPKSFLRFVRKEAKLLGSSLPAGIVLKNFEDRIDLYSAMIKGPEGTPYEDGLFFFDFQLPQDYPKSPPACHFYSFCTDKLNPNLYEEGKVCVSLLGTWSGKGTEIWTPNSNLLQLLVSIQALILVKEPYFNEAGFESQRTTLLGKENSWMYNEMVVIKLAQSMTGILRNPPMTFINEIKEHINECGDKFYERLEKWKRISFNHHNSPESNDDIEPLDFPLLPASKGFCISLERSLKDFNDAIKGFRSSYN